MTDFYSRNRCVCSTRSHGPLLCAFCLSFHFNFANSIQNNEVLTTIACGEDSPLSTFLCNSPVTHL